MKNHLKKFAFLYLFFIVFIFFIFSGVHLFFVEKDMNSDNQNKNKTDVLIFNENWEDKLENKINISDLTTVRNTEINKPFELYNTLPKNINNDVTLYFRSTNIGITVYLDGDKVYENGYDLNPIFGSSSGAFWNIVTIPKEYEGKPITFEITRYYDVIASINDIYIGDGTQIQMNIFHNDKWILSYGIILSIIGLLFISIDVPFSRFRSKKHDLLFLGSFSLIAAVWILFNSKMLSFLWHNPGSIHYIAESSGLIIFIPLLLYFKERYDVKRKNFINIGIIMNILSFVICNSLHFTGICEMHYSSHICNIFNVVYIFIVMLATNIEVIKSESSRIQKIQLAVSSFILVFAACWDTIAYFTSVSSELSNYIGPTIIFFIISSGLFVVGDISHIAKLGEEAEVVEQIAFSDALTNVGNRAAFKINLEQLEREKDLYPSIGLVMFDINDLKITNDVLGHKMGDQLIITGARIIKISFGKIGTCYRIGGDEFAVIITSRNLEADYEQTLSEFEGLIFTHNNRLDAPFKLKIAYGSEFYQRGDGTPLSKVLEKADEKMYYKKKNMKIQEAVDKGEEPDYMNLVR